jgi:hypothetical protein
MEKKYVGYNWSVVLHFVVTIVVFLGVLYGGFPNLQHFGIVLALVSSLILINAHKVAQGRNLVNSPISILALILVTFLFPISNSIRWGILVAYACLILLLDQDKRKSISLTSVIKIVNISLLFIILTELFKKVSNYSLQLFSFGYDNAFHFAIFRYFRSSTWFPFGLESKWGTDFGMFHTYPTGQAALWSFLAEPLIGNSVDPLENLAAYTFILATCVYLMIFFVFRQIRPTSGGFFSTLLAPLLLSVLINVTFSFILFTNGFLPYFFGLLFVLMFIDSYKRDENSVSRIILFALVALILVLVSPSIVAFIALPAVLVIVSEIKKMLVYKQFVSLAISIAVGVIILVIILWIAQKTTSTYGWRQILAPGGIRQPSVLQAAAVISGCLVALVLQRKKIVKNLLLLVTVSGLISVGILISLTVLYTGSIQYYALKQAYVSLAISSIVLCKYLLHIKIVARLRVISILGISLILILPNIVPRALNSGFMGALAGVASHTLRQGNWNTEVVDANRIFDSLVAESQVFRNESPCLIFRVTPFDSDLNSRWLNSLSPKPNISNSCFAGFWNSGALKGDQLIEKLENLPGNFVIVIDPIQAEQFPKILPPNITTMVIS